MSYYALIMVSYHAREQRRKARDNKSLVKLRYYPFMSEKGGVGSLGRDRIKRVTPWVASLIFDLEFSSTPKPTPLYDTRDITRTQAWI